MNRTFVLAFALLAPLLAIAQAPSTSLAREAAVEMMNHYRFARGAGMLQAEERCWTEARTSRKSPQLQALGCARLMIAGGVIDQAMQVSERRGPVAAFDPAVQRQRYLDRTAAMGMTQPEAQQVLQKAAAEIPAIVEGLSLTGVR